MEIEIVFEVEFIIFRDIQTGYTVARTKIKKHPKDVSIPSSSNVVSGNFPVIHVGDEFKAVGSWVSTAKGCSFKVTTASLVLPETEKGMIDFLSKIVKGIGKKTAERIVEKFKEESFDVIMNRPEELKGIKRLGDKNIDKLHKQMLMYKDFEEVAMFLIPLGVSHTQAVLIYEKLGYSSISIIEKNPYILLDHSDLPLKLIDKMARNLNIPFDDKSRVEYGLLYFIKYMMNSKGDLFTYYDYLVDNLSQFLRRVGSYGIFQDIDKEKIKESMTYLEQMKKISIMKDNSGNDCVYLSYYHHVEKKIVDYITDMNTMPLNFRYNKKSIKSAMEMYENKTEISLAKKQKEAVFMAMENKISVLSGGPGTGKSHTISAILDCISTLNPLASVELAAPTGRAAKRITELTGRAAKTIHRLIGLGANDDEEELITVDSDFLIIDEASMIDAYVFYKLLSVISYDTRVLIVGDYEQLPSVGPGLILRDIINSKTVHTTILNEIFRQAQDSQIVMNCHKLISGVKVGDENGITFDKDKKDFYFIENTNIRQISSLIIRSVERLIETGVPLDDIQVLSVMNKGELGVNELNKKIQDRFNPRSNKRDTVLQIGDRELRLNDRVMQTVNNYDLEVFNGEVGKIVSIKNADRLSELEVLVDFGDREIVYDLEFISELTLSYAITVHKSQGSEFKYVLIPFHHSLKILLNRNIIYTAWSRAKERVVCVGDMEELNRGIDRIDNLSRNSNIIDGLIKNNEVIQEEAYA